MKDERRVLLHEIACEEGTSLVYEYDFGNGWQHVIRVEHMWPRTPNSLASSCLEGAPRDRRDAEHKEVLIKATAAAPLSVPEPALVFRETEPGYFERVRCSTARRASWRRVSAPS
jgi:hypothetical protein